MVEEGLRAFNVERLYATDKAVTALLVTEAARTLPMMAPRRVVIVLSAEKMLAPKKKGAAREPDGRRRGARRSRAATRLPAEPVAHHVAGLRVLGCRRRARRDPAGEEPAHHEGAGEGRDAGAVHRPRWGQGPFALGGRACEGRRPRDRPPGRDEAAPAARATIRDGCAPTSKSCCCLLPAPGGSPGPRRGHRRRRPCITATTGRWSARSRQETRPGHFASCKPRSTTGASRTRFSGRSDTPSGRRRRAAGSPRRRVPAAVEALFRTDVAMKSSGGDPRVLLERLIVELCG